MIKGLQSITMIVGLMLLAVVCEAKVIETTRGWVYLDATNATKTDAAKSEDKHTAQSAAGNRHPNFRFIRIVEKTPEGRKVTSKYQELSGRDLVVEEVYYKGDSDLSSYRIVQKQISEDAGIAVRDGKLFYAVKRPDGKLENRDESISDNTVIIDQMVQVIRKRWSDLAEGEHVHIRFVVPSRMETVGFTLQKDRETSDRIVIKMRPQSFVISLFVNPIYLEFEKSGEHRIMSVVGRLPIKRFHDGNDYSDVEGTLNFDYDSSMVKGSATN